ncbi:hypothetical protein ACFP3Q_06010 [Nocardioides sp. GCM10027113]|uniref:hypothetical protein n=1 Tax=unclassified Nocardioides TaxID=2615069 RepID=UPI00361CF1EC
MTGLASMRAWSGRRWATATGTAVTVVLLVAVPTDLVDTPFFSREIPPTWWAWPGLLLTAVLGGLVAATYVDAAPGAQATTPGSPGAAGARPRTAGWWGGVLTFLAVGCPVCNKVVLLLLGTSGALTWFEPLQPLLQVVAVLLLGAALVVRLRGEVACPVDLSPMSTGPGRVRGEGA